MITFVSRIPITDKAPQISPECFRAINRIIPHIYLSHHSTIAAIALTDLLYRSHTYIHSVLFLSDLYQWLFPPRWLTKRYIICFHVALRRCKKVSPHLSLRLTLLIYFSTELQQRDRLVDRLVYLDVLNLREIRLTLLHGPRPRTSAILLLAALLRVSDCFGSMYVPISYLSSHIPIDSPSIFVLILSTPRAHFILSTSGRACSHHLLGIHSASTSFLRFPSARDQLLR
jgi:hypothetical protein